MKSSLQENVMLAPWTTFGVGGPARYFLDAFTEEDVLAGLEFAQSQRLDVFVLGGGSNLVVADSGFPGLVLRVSIRGIEWSGDHVAAGAGEDWDGLVAGCVERGLGGVECLSGIPGSVGGTPIQNVGAYGQEVSNVLVDVRVLERETGVVREMSQQQCEFAYRSSVFNTTGKGQYIVLRVHYALKRNAESAVHYPDLVRRFEGKSAPSLLDVRQAVREIRASKGMLIVQDEPDCRSAGSFFKNPIITESAYAALQSSINEPVPRYPATTGKVKTSAAWLIERAGFKKGFSLGPAAVSRKHTLALVNTGGASAQDILRLAAEIRRGVEERFGIRLIPEPVFVGFTEDF